MEGRTSGRTLVALMKQLVLICFVFVVAAMHGNSACGQRPATFQKWERIEFVFNGPASRGRGQPNPFAVALDARFTSPSGKTYKVPGFYDGDGIGGLNGNVWKVRFSADELGLWNFETDSSHQELGKRRGRFRVVDTKPGSRGFWKWGRLEHSGTAENAIRYLKFRDGPYWLKAGCDDPENFLGRYRNYNTLAKRKAAVDYLARLGINSLYIMTHNIRGDDRDVWPWLGQTATEAMANGGSNSRFDPARLEEWRVLFEHMQARGVVPYLVLEDDSAWKGYDHSRYWREIIARFGYLPAVVFNMGEEHNENYRLSEGLKLAGRFRQLDPYKHPLGIHNVNRADDSYVDSPFLDFTAIQTGSPGRQGGLQYATQHNRLAIQWIQRCRARGRRVLMVNFDEGRPEQDRRAWWSAYLAGGVWEAHVLQPYDRPLSAWSRVWTELGGTRAFMEQLPFAEMNPYNEIVKKGQAFCLAKPDAVYALYLPSGGQIEILLPQNQAFRFSWWNPANGFAGRFGREARIGGGIQKLSAPGKGDWAVRIVRADDG